MNKLTDSQTQSKQAPANHIKISCNIDKETYVRLVELAKKTGRPKSFYVRQAVVRQIGVFEEQAKSHSIKDFEENSSQ